MESRRTRKSDRLQRFLSAAVVVLIIAVILFFVVPMTCVALIMRKNFTRYEYADDRFTCDYRYEHYAKEYPRTEVQFKSGRNTLHGYIYGADNTEGLIVFAHGIGTGHESYIEILLSFVDRGWRVFAYDATGSCTSEGKGTKGLSQSALDLNNALTFAENDSRLSGLPIYVMGHSWGGFASAAVLNFDHNVKACATLSGYYLPMKELMDTAENMMGGFSKVMKPYIWLYNKLVFGKYSDLNAVEGINKSDIPVLVIHGSNDKTVRYKGASIISQKDSITNEHVKYKVMKKKGMRGHNNYLFSKKAMSYINKTVNPAYKELFHANNGEISDEDLEAFYDSLDADLINEINMDIVDAIDEFYRSA